MRSNDVDEVRLSDAGSLKLSPGGKDGRLEHDLSGRAEISHVSQRGHVRV